LIPEESTGNSKARRCDGVSGCTFVQLQLKHGISVTTPYRNGSDAKVIWDGIRWDYDG
jgi:hypothetical protein